MGSSGCHLINICTSTFTYSHKNFNRVETISMWARICKSIICFQAPRKMLACIRSYYLYSTHHTHTTHTHTTHTHTTHTHTTHTHTTHTHTHTHTHNYAGPLLSQRSKSWWLLFSVSLLLQSRHFASPPGRCWLCHTSVHSASMTLSECSPSPWSGLLQLDSALLGPGGCFLLLPRSVTPSPDWKESFTLLACIFTHL
jgi:hypothetical protein